MLSDTQPSCLASRHCFRGEGEHVCLRNREQPVFTFFREEWSLSWPPPKIFQSFCNSWPLVCETLFFSHSCCTHTERLYPLSVWLCWSGFYSVSDNNLPGFLPTVLLMSPFSWTPVPVVCQQFCIMYTKQAVMDNSAHEEREILSGGSIFSCQWVHQCALSRWIPASSSLC